MCASCSACLQSKSQYKCFAEDCTGRIVSCVIWQSKQGSDTFYRYEQYKMPEKELEQLKAKKAQGHAKTEDEPVVGD